MSGLVQWCKYESYPLSHFQPASLNLFDLEHLDIWVLYLFLLTVLLVIMLYLLIIALILYGYVLWDGVLTFFTFMTPLLWYKFNFKVAWKSFDLIVLSTTDIVVRRICFSHYVDFDECTVHFFHLLTMWVSCWLLSHPQWVFLVIFLIFNLLMSLLLLSHLRLSQPAPVPEVPPQCRYPLHIRCQTHQQRGSIAHFGQL